MNENEYKDFIQLANDCHRKTMESEHLVPVDKLIELLYPSDEITNMCKLNAAELRELFELESLITTIDFKIEEKHIEKLVDKFQLNRNLFDLEKYEYFFNIENDEDEEVADIDACQGDILSTYFEKQDYVIERREKFVE